METESTFGALLMQNHLLGVVVGLCVFLVIGLFHPLVIKGEYYFGTRCWVAFLLLGLICLVAAFLVTDLFWSPILGVIAFSSFWSIKEVFDQKKRVEKGWFPSNPKRMGK